MANKKLTLEEFFNKANIVHENKYDYSLVENCSTRNYIEIICPIHGNFSQRVSAHLSGQGCKKCRNESVGNRFRYDKEDFLKDVKEIHGSFYDYSKFVYINDKIKGIIICPIHNLEFYQTPNNHKKTKGCPKCSKESFSKNKRNSLEKTINLCIEEHGKDSFDYSKLPIDLHSHDKVEIKCNSCGNTFQQLMYSHSNNGNGCPICKRSKFERKISNFIKDELGLSIKTSDREILNGKEIDILIPEKKIGIEINGNYWHSELISKEDKNYHLNKTDLAKTKEIFLLQFFEDEMVNKFEICKSIIKNKLGKFSNKIYGRKCVIKEIDVKTKNNFLDKNHIQGKDQSKVKLGLFYENELVSLMTFGSPRYNKKVEWELIRFCNKIDTLVIGAASKLFEYFLKKYNPKSIISYADKRISRGEIYNILKFNYSHDALPRYYYMHRNNYLKRIHRSNFTKDKIKRLYPEVDIINNDEWSIMKNLNYDRIWDCGNIVYIWKNI